MAQRTAIAGVSGDRPRAVNSRAISANVVSPMKITSVSATLTHGSTNNPISGKRFNGFSQGAYYGDDAGGATNYPIVMIKNNGTGDICFGRSHDFSRMGVAGTKTTNAQFDVPSSCEMGASTLTVSVNGISSKGIAVTVN